MLVDIAPVVYRECFAEFRGSPTPRAMFSAILCILINIYINTMTVEVTTTKAHFLWLAIN